MTSSADSYNPPSKQITYDISSNNDYSDIITNYDEAGHVEEKYFDKAGNVVKQIRYLGMNKTSPVETKFKYNLLSQLHTVISPEGKVINYLYDDIGNISERHSKDDSTYQYKYDKYGNLRFSRNIKHT